jgi:hypothetical protein
VALFEGVPQQLGGVLALDELGNVWRDAEADVTHHTLIILVPILLLLGGLVNLTLISDIPISASNLGRDGETRHC